MIDPYADADATEDALVKERQDEALVALVLRDVRAARSLRGLPPLTPGQELAAVAGVMARLIRDMVTSENALEVVQLCRWLCSEADSCSVTGNSLVH